MRSTQVVARKVGARRRRQMSSPLLLLHLTMHLQASEALPSRWFVLLHHRAAESASAPTVYTAGRAPLSKHAQHVQQWSERDAVWFQLVDASMAKESARVDAKRDRMKSEASMTARHAC